MKEWQQRTAALLGEAALNKLENSRVIVFGVGGVGGYTAEALARAGVGEITLVDKDDVDVTNINRQIVATTLTVGLPKVEVLKRRLQEINPQLKVVAIKEFYLADTADKFDLSAYDCVVDAVDTVTAKLLLAERCSAANTEIVSCMGAGNKVLPYFKVADVSKTAVCPLAKVMRKQLKRRGIERLTVVYSEEQPRPPILDGIKPTPSSISYVPASAGLVMAYAVIDKLIGAEPK